MNKLYKQTALLSLALTLAITPACSDSSGGTEKGNDSNPNEPVDVNAKYDPPITITAVRDQDPSMSFKEGENFETNNWTKAYLDELGIKVKYDWIVPNDQYNAKLNIAIASNKLPDVFKVNSAQLKQLVEADALADLTDAYETYGSELTKKSIELGPLAKASATFDGKLMAIPPDESFDGNLSLLWLRADWLKKLNLEAPKSWADLEKIMEAFVNEDPDGNGEKDTYGLALTKSVYSGGVAEATGVFNAFGAYPNLWIEKDGKLEYGSVQPEIREALLKLQEMFKKGWIDPEFGVKDAGKVGEDFANNKVGVNFGALWNSLWPLQDTVTKNEQADWIVADGVSATGNTLKYAANLNFDSFMVVSKKAKNPEAVIKLLNLMQDKVYSGNADPKVFHTEIVGDKEFAHFKEKLVEGGTNPIGGNFGHYQKVTAALASKDSAGLNPEQKGYYDKIVAYEGGDRTTWGTARVFGPESSYKVIEKIIADKDANLMFTKFYGAPTETMTTKRSTLEKMQIETFTRIILGSPIEEFDKFADDWKKLGGDKITDEVNAWYSAQ